MYISKNGLNGYTWEVNNSPEMEKRRIVRSLPIPQELSLGAEVPEFSDRIAQLWAGLDALKSKVAQGTKIELPEDVKEKLKGVVQTAGQNWVPIALGVGVVAVIGYFVFAKK